MASRVCVVCMESVGGGGASTRKCGFGCTWHAHDKCHGQLVRCFRRCPICRRLPTAPTRLGVPQAPQRVVVATYHVGNTTDEIEAEYRHRDLETLEYRFVRRRARHYFRSSRRAVHVSGRRASRRGIVCNSLLALTEFRPLDLLGAPAHYTAIVLRLIDLYRQQRACLHAYAAAREARVRRRRMCACLGAMTLCCLAAFLL